MGLISPIRPFFISTFPFVNTSSGRHEFCLSNTQMKTQAKGIVMNQHELIAKWNDLRGNFQNLFGQKIQRLLKKDSAHEDEVEGIETQKSDPYLDDLPLTLNRDPSPGITFYPTENSEFARGAATEIPRGLDSFGEEDTFEFEEADDYQTNRDRKQNSDLSKRFYTSGLHLDD